MGAEEACVVDAESGQDVCIPVHDINNEKVRKEGTIRKLKVVLSAVFCTKEEAEEEVSYKDSKTLSIFSGIIMGANCSAITSLPSSHENRDEGVCQAVLIPATLSLMTTLFIIAAQVAMPTFNFRRAKKLVALAIIFTACSYTAFVAMKLVSISQGTVVAIIFATTYMFFNAIVFLSPKFRVKSPEALG